MRENMNEMRDAAIVRGHTAQRSALLEHVCEAGVRFVQNTNLQKHYQIKENRVCRI
jgi:pyridoxine/pyridoxamine 5'-phosphate oxidase